MRHHRRWVKLVSLFIAGVMGVQAQTDVATGAVGAVEPAGFRSHGDIRTVNVEEELDALRSDNANLVGSTARKPVNFAAAIAKARELARAAVAPAALERTLQALPNREAGTLRLFAVAQLATGQPSAAFAVLVAAHDRDPQSPDPLADLAGMLAGFGYANEAIAILDELAARNLLPAPPMGLEGRDVVDYIRGYALVRLGDTARAEPLLRGVTERQPALAEAPRMLAIISEDPEEQRKYLLLGVWRHRSPQMVATGVDITDPEPDPVTEGEEVAVDARSLIDLSEGKPGRLPTMRYAMGVPQANDLVMKMQAAKQAANERFTAIVNQRVRPKPYIHTETSIEETWGYRMQQLANSIDYRDAKLRDLDRRRRAADRERVDAFHRIEDERDEKADAAVKAYMEECLARNYNPTAEQIGEKARPAFEAALTQFKPYINREEQAIRDWFAEWHLLATAIAAQVGDEGWHEYIRLSIEAERWSNYRRLLHLVDMHATIGQHALITKEAGEVSTEPEEDDVDKCDGNASIGFTTKTLPGGTALPFEFGVEMTCEGMSLEAAVDTRIPGLSVSAEIGGDNSGSFTAFVGPKYEVSVGAKEIVEFAGSVKGGGYVTGDRHGVTDAGVKYEVKTSAKIGSLSASQKIAEGSVSFIPAPTSGLGEFGAIE